MVILLDVFTHDESNKVIVGTHLSLVTYELRI